MKQNRLSMLAAILTFCGVMATQAQTKATDDASQFVTLTDAVPDAILEIRYFSTYNFVGDRIDGYQEPTALLTRVAADSLRAVSDDLKAQGYRLKIYDAYRPQMGVDHFVRWGRKLSDTRMKPYFYPDLNKNVLFKQDYIAEKSGHTRGSTLDLTLFDMRTEKEVDMGGTFDWFGPESHPDFCGNPETGKYTGNNKKSPKGRSITAKQFENRMILRRAMMRHGFKPYDCEWWHFTLRNEPFPNTYFTFPVRQLKNNVPTACAVQKEGVNNFRIKRGTNVSHWLSQSEQRGEARRLHIQEDDFARLEELGFDFVRIPIDEVQFWDEKGNKLPEAWNLLNSALDWARTHNLRAIVDLHIIRSHYFNAVNEGDKAANTLFTSEKAQQDLINLWYQLSDFLKWRSCDWVAYEFMNEPVADEHEQWNKLVAKVHKVLRQREPQRTLVIGSNRWQGHETMKYLKVPEGDKNIILSFHYYNPMILTHYGAWWTPLGQYKGKVSYPGVLVSKKDYDAAPDAIKPDLKQYTEQVWNIDKIREQFKDAIEAAKKYDLQLFCGEWGVYEPVDRELAYNWYRDMLTVFDEFNIAWTTWCYDADFGFWDQQRHTYKDRPLVELLMSGKGLDDK